MNPVGGREICVSEHPGFKNPGLLNKPRWGKRWGKRWGER